MNPVTASFIFGTGILALFLLNRDRKTLTSKALWLPVIWLSIGASRNVAEWLQSGVRVDAGDVYLEGNPVDRDVLGALLVIGIIVLLTRHRRTAAILRANAPILAFIFYCGVSVLWSDFPYVGFKRWFRLLGDCVMVLIVLTDVDSLAAIKRLFGRTAFVLLPVSVLLIRYYSDLGRSYDTAGSVFWTGVATGKNGLGVLCLVLGIASTWRFLAVYRGKEGPHRFRRLIAHGAVLAIALWLFWVGNSMTSLSCFLVASSLMVVTSFRWPIRHPMILHLLVTMAVAIPVCVLFLGVGGNILGKMGRDSTLTGRTAIWELVLQFVVNPLWGAGYESFWLGNRLTQIAAIHKGGFTQAHNGYLEIYLNLGWIGVVLLAVVIVAGYRNVMTAIRVDPEVGRLKLAYFVTALIYNCTEAGFKFMFPVWLGFLLATVAIPNDRSRGVKLNGPQETKPDSRNRDSVTHGWAHRSDHVGTRASLRVMNWIARAWVGLLVLTRHLAEAGSEWRPGIVACRGISTFAESIPRQGLPGSYLTLYSD